MGGCEDLFVFVCVRQPNTTKMNREACSFFIAGNGTDIINRDLTPADVININVCIPSVFSLTVSPYILSYNS